jgi:hypothetical protein
MSEFPSSNIAIFGGADKYFAISPVNSAVDLCTAVERFEAIHASINGTASAAYF